MKISGKSNQEEKSWNLENGVRGEHLEKEKTKVGGPIFQQRCKEGKERRTSSQPMRNNNACSPKTSWGQGRYLRV